jgi:NAD(P)H-dependent FMN reductase
MGACLPNGTTFAIYEGIDTLPHFNPSLDAETAPAAVEHWRKALAAADGVIICTPEYAFGVPGSLKNALDWTVSSGSFNEKPVAIVTASSSGHKAHAALLDIFTALGASVPEDATLLIPFVRTKVNSAGKITDEATGKALYAVTHTLLQAVGSSKAEQEEL